MEMKIDKGRRSLLKAAPAAALLPASVAAEAATATSGKTGSSQKPIRIAVMTFIHETVTFLPYDTVTDDFIYEIADPQTCLEMGQSFQLGGYDFFGVL